MSTGKAEEANGIKPMTRFEAMRQTLLKEKFASRLDKPLAYWTLPSDRRLPLAFLGRTLRDLLTTPFEQLLATPGVGEKKISSLMELLQRATQDSPPKTPCGADMANGRRNGASRSRNNSSSFDPAVVSEVLWDQWRTTVKQRGLGELKLGRLAPMLQKLPTVIWHKRLEEYVDLTVADIRQLKTHGEKRVRAVLEVFCVVHEALAKTTMQDHLDVNLLPKFVVQIERWMTDLLTSDRTGTVRQLEASLVRPLVKQIEIDVGLTVSRLAAERLGLNGPAKSVRQQAKQMGVTRARVYQLLEECSKVMEVRWPEGGSLMKNLRDWFVDANANEQLLERCNTVVDVFFPGSEHLTQIVEPVASEPVLA